MRFGVLCDLGKENRRAAMLAPSRTSGDAHALTEGGTAQSPAPIGHSLAQQSRSRHLEACSRACAEGPVNCTRERAPARVTADQGVVKTHPGGRLRASHRARLVHHGAPSHVVSSA